MMILAFFLIKNSFKLTDESTSKLSVVADKIFHAHYTAGLLEDEIRRIRSEDYVYRKKYDELRKEAAGI